MAGTGYVEWKEVANKKEGSQRSDGSKQEYLWLKGGKTYKIRPIHKPVRFFKYFTHDQNRKLRTAICQDPDNCPVQSSHTDLKKATERYAIYVIDREDSKIKIMEGPRTVFLPMKYRCEQTGKSPGGNDGGDWAIVVKGAGLKTEYICTYLEDTPFNDSEKRMITEEFKDEKHKLAQVYHAHTSEEIEKRLFADLPNNEQGDKNGETDQAHLQKSAAPEKFDVNW